jgi:hypothetical protein
MKNKNKNPPKKYGKNSTEFFFNKNTGKKVREKIKNVVVLKRYGKIVREKNTGIKYDSVILR